MSCVQKTALILIRIYDQEKSFTWLWLAFQILPRIRIPAQDPVSVQPSEAPECLLDRWAAIYEDPRKSSSYSNGCKKKNGHWFKAKIWTHELCTYHPMFQFVDWKNFFLWTQSALLTQNAKGSVEMDKKNFIRWVLLTWHSRLCLHDLAQLPIHRVNWGLHPSPIDLQAATNHSFESHDWK